MRLSAADCRLPHLTHLSGPSCQYSVSQELNPRRDLNLEFEIPFRELGFSGVPHRTTSFVMPTVNCLVELTEMPFTVMTLGGEPLCRPVRSCCARATVFGLIAAAAAAEVNLVNLERVGFNLRNFDMVFIWKDLNRDVGRIDTIPSTSLDTIKVRGGSSIGA